VISSGLERISGSAFLNYISSGLIQTRLFFTAEAAEKLEILCALGVLGGEIQVTCVSPVS